MKKPKITIVRDTAYQPKKPLQHSLDDTFFPVILICKLNYETDWEIILIGPV